MGLRVHPQTTVVPGTGPDRRRGHSEKNVSGRALLGQRTIRGGSTGFYRGRGTRMRRTIVLYTTARHFDVRLWIAASVVTRAPAVTVAQVGPRRAGASRSATPCHELEANVGFDL